jgi:hypothetical protein
VGAVRVEQGFIHGTCAMLDAVNPRPFHLQGSALANWNAVCFSTTALLEPNHTAEVTNMF